MRKTVAWFALSTFVNLLTTLACGAAEVDLHKAWEDRCGDCHAHAAALARTLEIVDGRLVGRHHEDLREFLRHHYLQDERVDAVYDMLLAQASAEGQFRNACASCHGSAAEFARAAVEFRRDTLYGRNTGRPVREFLDDHRSLSAQDAKFFAELLQRVALEVGLR